MTATLVVGIVLAVAGAVVSLNLAGTAVSFFQDAWDLWTRDRRMSWSTLMLAVAFAAMALFVFGASLYTGCRGTCLAGMLEGN